jgi:hypothetical protein
VADLEASADSRYAAGDLCRPSVCRDGGAVRVGDGLPVLDDEAHRAHRLMLFGARRLPDLALSSGRALRIFKAQVTGAGDPVPSNAPPRPDVVHSGR